MHTPEDRLFTSLRSIIGAAEVTEKVASASEEQASEQAEITKIAEMSVEEIMNNEVFLKGVSDRVAQRSQEIEAMLQEYILE